MDGAAVPRNGRDLGNSGRLNCTILHTVAFSPGLVGKDGREVLQGAALGVERVHLSVTDPVDFALKTCFLKGLKRRYFFRVDQMMMIVIQQDAIPLSSNGVLSFGGHHATRQCCSGVYPREMAGSHRQSK